MPELCEVQIMTENLARWCVGQTVVSLTVPDEKLRAIDNGILDNQTIIKVWRRAKYSILETASHALVIHYRMTGQVVLVKDETRFVRCQIHLHNDTAVGFVDPRRFGTVDLLSLEALPKWLADKSLGEEIWPVAQSGDWWAQQFSGIQSAIKIAMLRQDRVVGIGNILASEFCFAAKVSPFLRTNTLSSQQWHALAISAKERLEAILEEERGEKIGFLFEGAKKPSAFQIYGREGEVCSVCASTILKVTQANRATYFCPSCQGVSDN